MSAKSSPPGARWSPIITLVTLLYLILGATGICKEPFSIFFRTFVGSSSNLERCQSDRLGRTRNPVNGLSVPGV